MSFQELMNTARTLVTGDKGLLANPLEAEGVLNPAAVRGPDGQFYLFPRLVAQGNYSRIGIARVRFDDDGDPVGVERLGIAMEPEADYEMRSDGSGGCEDPRITFVERFQRYVMTYTAHSRQGPRIALAVSEDLFRWKRLGLATFEPYHGIDFVHVDNKDASLFPVAIPNHAGKMQLAILHRPLFSGTRPEETVCQAASRMVDIDHESIWISYCPMALEGHQPKHLDLFNSHHRLASPVSPWERLKIGGGTPPLLTRHVLMCRNTCPQGHSPTVRTKGPKSRQRRIPNITAVIASSDCPVRTAFGRQGTVGQKRPMSWVVE